MLAQMALCTAQVRFSKTLCSNDFTATNSTTQNMMQLELRSGALTIKLLARIHLSTAVFLVILEARCLSNGEDGEEEHCQHRQR